MERRGSGHKVMGWITLIFQILFLLLGFGIVFGIFLPDNLFPNQGMRILLGMLLIGYAAVRGIFVFRNLRA